MSLFFGFYTHDKKGIKDFQKNDDGAIIRFIAKYYGISSAFSADLLIIEDNRQTED